MLPCGFFTCLFYWVLDANFIGTAGLSGEHDGYRE